MNGLRSSEYYRRESIRHLLLGSALLAMAAGWSAIHTMFALLFFLLGVGEIGIIRLTRWLQLAIEAENAP